MSNELATVDHGGSTLAIQPEQQGFTSMQVSALQHIGVDKASEGDLAVFFHVCQRTGLDPFARQVYMIGRQTSEKDASGQWIKVTKQTIQTGIDGFRLIGRRAANAASHGLSVSAPEWAKDDGSWRPVWVGAWGLPIAARVTIHRNGEPFTAVALFDEYKQTKYGGELTAVWAQRPAGQLAKCAEALAWRMAFPQDLSGIYADEEMGQADNAPVRHQPQSGGLASVLADPSPAPDAGADDAPLPVRGDGDDAGEDQPDGITSSQLKKMGAAMRERGLTEREDALAYVESIIGREIASRNDLTKAEASDVIDALETPFAEQPTPEPVEAEWTEGEGS